jgi:hypothetical protein
MSDHGLDVLRDGHPPVDAPNARRAERPGRTVGQNHQRWLPQAGTVAGL